MLRSLRRRLDENPLLRHEAGWGEGRPWWKSPATLLIVGGTVLLVTEVTITMWRWAIWSQIRLTSVPDAVIEARSRTPAAFGVLATLSGGLALVLLVLPPWLCAKSWARDRDLGAQRELAPISLTVESVLQAKLEMWCGLWFLTLIPVIILNGLLAPLAAIVAPEYSLLWLVSNWGEGDVRVRHILVELGSPTWTEFASLRRTPIDPSVGREYAEWLMFSSGFVLFGALLMGLTAHFSLSLGRPALSLTVALLLTLAAALIVPVATGRDYLLSPTPGNIVMDVLLGAPLIGAAVIPTWMTLSRRVARAYGLKR